VPLLTLLGLAVGLAMDALAVAIAVGLTLEQITPRHVFRLAFHFGLFQFLMPIIGWLAGNQVAEYIGAYDHWAAFGLLSFVGGKMLYESRRQDEAKSRDDPTRGLMLVTLSVATSLDALAVGLSLALTMASPGTGTSAWLSIGMPSVIIGIVAAAFTTVGIVFGGRLGARWESRAEIIGGCVLLAIGVRILWSHFFG
jgi:manganese efflux pump family protein